MNYVLYYSWLILTAMRFSISLFSLYVFFLLSYFEFVDELTV